MKYGYSLTYTAICPLVLNRRRYPSSSSSFQKYWHQPSILLTWDSDLLLHDDYPAPIWILWIGTERLVNPTSTTLLVEVTSLNTTVRFSLFCSDERLEPGAPKLCQLFEYNYVKVVHVKQPSVQNVWMQVPPLHQKPLAMLNSLSHRYAWTVRRKPKSLRDSDLKPPILLLIKWASTSCFLHVSNQCPLDGDKPHRRRNFATGRGIRTKTYSIR